MPRAASPHSTSICKARGPYSAQAAQQLQAVAPSDNLRPSAAERKRVRDPGSHTRMMRSKYAEARQNRDGKISLDTFHDRLKKSQLKVRFALPFFGVSDTLQMH